MGLDYRSLEPYGGFDKMYDHVIKEDNIGTGAFREFTSALYHILAGKDPANGIGAREGKGDPVFREIREGAEKIPAGHRPRIRALLAKKLGIDEKGLLRSEEL